MSTAAAEGTKTFFEEWMGSQQHALQQWMANAQQMQQQMQKGMASVMPQQAADFYKQMSEQQTAFYKQMVEAMGKYPQGFMNPAAFKNMPFATMPGMEQATAAMQQMMKQQSEYMQKFMGSNPFMASLEAMNGKGAAGMGNVMEFYNTWLKVSRETASTLSKSSQDWVSRFSQNPSEAMQGMFAGTDVYLKLLEFWMPIYKQAQEKMLTPDQLKHMASPARYKEVIDKMFEFGSPDALQEFYLQAGKVMDALNSNTQQAIKRYNDMMARNTKLLPEVLSGDPQAAVKIYENMYENYQKNFDPMLRATLNGRDGELLEIVKSIVSKYSQYASKFAEFQYAMYTTGQKAMDHLVEDVHGVLKNQSQAKDAKGFNEFFKQWAEVNEKAFSEVFKTDSFSKMQSELVNASMEIRGDFQRLLELYLADYPVVPRSEMDELYKTVHELKTKLRQLEKEDGKAEAAAPAASAEEGEKAAARKPAPKK